jgi:hypothetical protein
MASSQKELYDKIKEMTKVIQFQVLSPGLIRAQEADVITLVDGKQANTAVKPLYLLTKLKERVNNGDYVALALNDAKVVCATMTGTYKDLKKEIIDDFNLRQSMQTKPE